MRRDAPRFVYDLTAPVACAWMHRTLLRRLIQRDVESRFRGTVLGKLWVAVQPFITLAIYTFSFNLIIQPRWQAGIQHPSNSAFIYFSGLVLFTFFLECVARSPNLMRENVIYIKKVIFPVEILTWVAVGAAGFRLAISSTIFLLFYLAVNGLPPFSSVMVPVLVLPLCLIGAGVIWIISSLAVYLRDVSHFVGGSAPALMFVTPIFFPMSAVPDVIRPYFYLNPLTFVLENCRQALFDGLWPNWKGVLVYFIIAWAFAWLGHRFFMRLRPGFADEL